MVTTETCAPACHGPSSPSEKEFSDVKSRSQDTLNLLAEDSGSFHPASHSFLCDAIESASPTDHSRFMLMKVLVQAQQNDWSLLFRQNICSNKSISEREIQREVNKKKKLTEQQKEIIKQKRIKKMKKLDSTEITLSIYPGNMKKLEKEIGSGLHQFARKKDTYIEFQAQVNSVNMAANKQSTVLKVWGNLEDVSCLHSLLEASACKVQKEMDDLREVKIRAMSEKKKQKALNLENSKELKEDDFVLKAHKSAKNSKGKGKGSHNTRPTTTVLDGGHCLHCYKPFPGLHDTTTCKYHAGYKAEDEMTGDHRWSCCDQFVDTAADHYTQHKSTGCCEAKVHNWRTHEKAKGKDHDKSKLYSYH
ncbi:hypothetical protein MAR_025956 [Mya arenaria]|uniref:Uncharacterized protein n=1 Tax=Mya arenaria TaxID=6604 RepID=A0ABY7ESI8_MYAAR|nr:hypothetical protein MAR_025956 [Mya arenaria]